MYELDRCSREESSPGLEPMCKSTGVGQSLEVYCRVFMEDDQGISLELV